jgi:uncharacterized membrane protein YsdA (DUF1294 family)/cold shock CspA family protein
MRHQGRITEWNDLRGFGFISPLDGGDRVFVHVMAFRPDSRRPSQGQYVNYSLGRDERGRTRAEQATYIVSRSARSARPNGSRVGVVTAVLVAVGALAAISVGGWVGRFPLVVPAMYFLCSLGAYWHYRKDKAAARSKSRRAEEVGLLTWGLFGGWPGALVAQHQFRHKIKKRDFQIWFWISVALNCLGLWIVWSW